MPWDLGGPSPADIVNLSFIVGVWVLVGAIALIRANRGR